MLFDTFKNRITYSGILYTENPLHIGAGDESLEPGITDAAVVKNAKGLPYIPGSSLKGVLRSRLEMILSNPEVSNKWNVKSCDVFSKPCISRDFIKKNKALQISNPLDYANLIWERSCNVCKIFGNQSMAAHVQIKDLELLSGGEKELRNGVGIDRDTGTAVHGAKYEYDVVAAGSEFGFELTADNLDEQSQKLLGLLIGMLKNGEISIGAKTSRGLGKVRLLKVQESLQTAESLMQQYYTV
jgi:CRISPR-associated RAMP protein (TIGR02581 family)